VAAVASTSAFALAVLFHGRHARSRGIDDLLLAVTFGVTSLLEGTLALAGEAWPSTATVDLWSRLASRSVTAVVLCLTAWLPRRVIRKPVSRRRFVVLVLVGAALVFGSTIARLSTLEPAVVGMPPEDSALLGAPSVLAFRLACGVLLVAAAAGFRRRMVFEHDDLLPSLIAGSALLGIARFHDYLFPSLRGDWLTTGDMLRVVAQAVLLAGTARELRREWEQRAVRAATDERRRVAGELHDGLAQELAYLRVHSQLAARSAPSPALQELAASADRALVEARLAIAEFSRTDDVRLDPMMADLAAELGRRHGHRVEVELDEISVDSHTAYELVRVAREAVTNAARHAGADRIVLRLAQIAGRIDLSVTDDGVGIRPPDDGVPHPGFGLVSMRDRVRRLGGIFLLTPAVAPAHGTTVRAVVPLT
jgi:signal transduction histidine kinase